MTPAEVARHEGVGEEEILVLLEDEGFAQLVEDYRNEQSLPEDEREALLIKTAFASLQHLADMGDTKALLFLAYEANRGRHPENRLRRLVTRMADRHAELRAGEEIGTAPACEVGEATGSPIAAELASDLAGFARSNPDVADWILRYAESRQATLGESGAKAVEAKKGE